ncbi:MAG: ribonuclease R [Pseudomonadota bacterium]
MTDPHSSPLPSRQMIVSFLEEQGSDTSRRDIAKAFGIKGAARSELRALLKQMERDGLIDLSAGKRIREPGALPPVMPCNVKSVDDDGDLTLVPSSWRDASPPPKIILSSREAAKTKPVPGVGDRLLIRLLKTRSGPHRASVIRVLGEAAPRMLGVFRPARFGGVVEPVDKRARGKLTVDKPDTLGADEGDLVWYEPVHHRGHRSQRARVKEIAGRIDDESSYSEIALAAHGIPTKMPKEAIAEAQAAELPGIGDRADLRSIPLLTIDPADARDHDDAVWAGEDTDAANKGGFKVIVAIADVSWFVRPGTALDKEALRRGNSVYLPDRVVPMLPERLSNDLCSLREGEDRPCLAVEMQLRKDGTKISHTFMRGIMRSAVKLSYGDAQGRIDSMSAETADPIDTVLRHLFGAFNARMAERQKRAPLDLDLPELKIVFGDDGHVSGVEQRERFDAHRLIEEFMILANVAAAETLEKARTQQIYRIHDVPDPERLEATREYLETLGYSLVKGGSLRPRHFNQLLAVAAEREQKDIISEVVLRTQRQAVYSPENLGHFGLNLSRYSHFTSPIRRYADLTVHRALVRAMKLGEGAQTDAEAQNLERVAQDISDLERRAMAAERESKDRFLAAHLAERVGDTFAGRVRGVTRYGLFVSLTETGAEGFIPIRTLGYEHFRHEERLNAIISERTKRGFRLGQQVEVRLAEASPLAGGMRFDMLSDPIDLPRLSPGAAVNRPVKSGASTPGRKKVPGSRPKGSAKKAKPHSKETAKPPSRRKKARRANARSKASMD